MRKCIAVFSKKLHGSVTFEQRSSTDKVLVTVSLKRGRSTRQRAMHVHEFGDISDCGKCGGHWNPGGHAHRGRASTHSHNGDLGNIQFKNGVAYETFRTSKLTMYGHQSIVGRSVVIHVGVDDLGLGGTEASRTTGSAGGRLECAVIGYCST